MNQTPLGSNPPLLLPRGYDAKMANLNRIRHLTEAQIREKTWAIDGPQVTFNMGTSDTYDANFWGALGQQTIGDYLAARKLTQGFGTNILDLFGSAVFNVRHPELSGFYDSRSFRTLPCPFYNGD